LPKNGNYTNLPVHNIARWLSKGNDLEDFGLLGKNIGFA